PLTDRDAHEMVRAIRGWRLLAGFRGQPPADAAAAEEVLLRLSRMVEEIPDILTVDLNPVRLLLAGQGALVLDARVRAHCPAGRGAQVSGAWTPRTWAPEWPAGTGPGKCPEARTGVLGHGGQAASNLGDIRAPRPGTMDRTAFSPAGTQWKRQTSCNSAARRYFT